MWFLAHPKPDKGSTRKAHGFVRILGKALVAYGHKRFPFGGFGHEKLLILKGKGRKLPYTRASSGEFELVSLAL